MREVPRHARRRRQRRDEDDDHDERPDAPPTPARAAAPATTAASRGASSHAHRAVPCSAKKAFSLLEELVVLHAVERDLGALEALRVQLLSDARRCAARRTCSTWLALPATMVVPPPSGMSLTCCGGLLAAARSTCPRAPTARRDR